MSDKSATDVIGQAALRFLAVAEFMKASGLSPETATTAQLVETLKSEHVAVLNAVRRYEPQSGPWMDAQRVYNYFQLLKSLGLIGREVGLEEVIQVAGAVHTDSMDFVQAIKDAFPDNREVVRGITTAHTDAANFVEALKRELF